MWMPNRVRLPRMEAAVHAFLVGVVGSLSIVLLLPGNTFDLPAFSAFARVGTEHVWAWGLGAIALVASTGLMTKSRAWGAMSLFWLATTHGVIALCFYFGLKPGQPVTSACTTYGMIAAMGYYLFWFRMKTML